MGGKEMNFDKIVSLLTVAPKETYDYGCLMVLLPDNICSYWEIWKGMIDPNDYEEDGFEDEPHITVQYGFAPEVMATEVIAKVNPVPCMIKFGKLALFENDNDVLKIDIISPDLRKLNKAVMEKFSITTKYPDYKPHATIAYLKKGTGKKYLEKFGNPLKDKETLANKFSYSSPTHDKEYFYAFDPKEFYS